MSTVPSPRARFGEDESDVIVAENDEDTLEEMTYFVAIPLTAMLLLTVVIVVLCMRKQHVEINERRRQAIGAEGGRDLYAWERSQRRPPVNDTVEGSVNPAFEAEANPTPVQSQRVAIMPTRRTENEDVVNTVIKSPILPPHMKVPAGERGSDTQTAFEAKYGLLPVSTGQATPGFENHVEKPRSSSDQPLRPRLRPNGRSYEPCIVASLDASPAFQRLKYDHRGTLKRSSRKHSENEVQLSHFRTLATDLNDAVVPGTPSTTRGRSMRYEGKYNTLDMGSKGFRRSHRSREEEQEWARQNYLTIKKGKRVSRHLSKASFRSSRSAATSIEDLSSRSRQNSNWSLGTGLESRRPSNALGPSPYKLQVQNSIRPNKRVEYRQGIRTKSKSRILSNSLRRTRTSRKSRKDFEPNVNVVESPSFYMGFDIPLPPPTLGDIPEQKPANKPAASEDESAVSNTHSADRLNIPVAGGKMGERSVSVKSEHPYEEIPIHNAHQPQDGASTSDNTQGCFLSDEHG